MIEMVETMITVTCNDFTSKNGDFGGRVWAPRIIERNGELMGAQSERRHGVPFAGDVIR